MDPCGTRYKKGSSGLEGMSVQEMKDLLSSNGIDSKGNRKELCARIIEHNLMNKSQTDGSKSPTRSKSPSKSPTRSKSPAKSKSRSSSPAPVATDGEMFIEDYSDKSFVVRKTTRFTEKEHLDLQDLGGSSNRYLKGGYGYIFSTKRRAEVEEYISTGGKPAYKPKNASAGLFVEDYKFVVKGFDEDQRAALVAMGGFYMAKLKGGPGIVFDANKRKEVDTYISKN
jgi:hypothetical protein